MDCLFIGNDANQPDGGAVVIGCTGIADGYYFFNAILLDEFVYRRIEFLEFFFGMKNF